MLKRKLSRAFIALLSAYSLAALFASAATGQILFWNCKPYIQRNVQHNQCPERAICTTSGLASLDNRLNMAYWTIQKTIPKTLQASLRRYQRDWNAHRTACACDVECLHKQYKERVYYLENILAPTSSPHLPSTASPSRPSSEPKNQPLMQPVGPVTEDAACKLFPFLCDAKMDGSR
jgi:uncharacterized protein